MTPSTIISKVWSFCTTLRDDGVGYGDYLEQLTFLIFLKMADEYSKPPYERDVGVPEEFNWKSLSTRRGAELEVHYVRLLLELGKKPGMLGQIFTKAQNKMGKTGWPQEQMLKVRYTKACLKKMLRTPNLVQGNILHRAH